MGRRSTNDHSPDSAGIAADGGFAPVADADPTPDSKPTKPVLFDLSGIDLTQRLFGRDEIAQLNPHRGHMALIDAIVYRSPDLMSGIGLKIVRGDEFWVEGHFPHNPIMPGVLMLEAGAQMASYMHNARSGGRASTIAFARVEECSFRSMVRPGDELFLLCKGVRFTPRRIVSDLQGLVRGRVTFDARICGLRLGGGGGGE